MTIFSIILNPDFRIKGTYFGKISLHSLNISPLHKVEFSPTGEIGSGYPCVFWYLRLYREKMYIFRQSRKSMFTRINVLTLQLLTKLIQRS